MNFQILIFILLISFLPFLFANDLSVKKRDSNIFDWNGKVKREISLKVFSDVKKNESDIGDEVINVCGNEEGVECSCNLGELSCTNADLKTLNLRPIVEKFVIENVRLWGIKNLTLQKNKILPGNEKTIKNITFTKIDFIKVDNYVFDTFTSLETLFFGGTTLSSLNENILTEKLGNTLLKFVCFHCRLHNIGIKVFKNLVNLKELYLHGNEQINGKLNQKFPKSLSNLKILSLNACNLTFLDDDTFERLTYDDEFHIAGCNISVLHEILLDWKNVEKFILFGNPFACNCSMAWLFNDLMSNNSIYDEKLTQWYYPDKQHKFYLGCLGPPPTTPNHTIPYTIVEIFSSCKNDSSSSNNYLYFLSFFGLIALVAIFVYSNKLRLGNLLPRFI